VHVGVAGELALLDTGDHGIVRRYKKSSLAEDLRDRQPSPSAYLPGARYPLFMEGARGRRSSYANETRPEWLYFLDEKQVGIIDEVVDAVEDALLGAPTGKVHFFLGGPETERMSILLQLLMRLSDQVVSNKETWGVQLDISDRLAAFIEASTGWDLSSVREPLDPSARDVVLVDDSSSLAVVESYGR
jgi:hypothetical protein